MSRLLHTRSRWGRTSLALLASAAVTGAVFVAPAVADEAPDLGPRLIETGQAPSGYAVEFRYDAPEDVEQVHIYGDWTYSVPENVTCDGCGDGRLPYDWQPGDIAATQWRTIPMEQGADGIWQVEVALPAGSFRYAFTHDCDSIVATGCDLHYDPANPWEIFPQYEGAPGAVRSTYWVPENDEFPTYETDYQRPVPADRLGTLESVRYDSPLSTRPAGVHDMLVYTPAGYDADRTEPYPTLYLSHGGGDHSTAWFMQGVAHYIVQNAIDQEAAAEMVVVATDFNGLPGGNEGYVNELRNNIFPYMEEHYNVSSDGIDRAFAGFSAGGSRASTILYNHPEMFGYHGVWSATPPPFDADDIAAMNSVEGAIMIGTGAQDPLGNIGANVQIRQAELLAAGVDIDAFNVPGGHTWHSWRPLLNHYITDVIFDADRDGVADTYDVCAGTEFPDLPGADLRPNHYVATEDGFIDRDGNVAFSLADTGGCSGSQIIDAEGLGNGHSKFGLSRGVLNSWINSLD